jgi:hypothetical protein
VKEKEKQVPTEVQKAPKEEEKRRTIQQK